MYGLLDELKHHFWFFFAYTTNIAAGETLFHPVGFQITISIYNHHHCLTKPDQTTMTMIMTMTVIITPSSPTYQ